MVERKQKRHSLLHGIALIFIYVRYIFLEFVMQSEIAYLSPTENLYILCFS